VDAVTEAHIARALAAHTDTVIVISTSPVLLGACDRVIDVPSHGSDAPHE
jgi:ABC-type multidrug transport system fused ATPase/permease subunit